MRASQRRSTFWASDPCAVACATRSPCSTRMRCCSPARFPRFEHCVARIRLADAARSRQREAWGVALRDAVLWARAAGKADRAVQGVHRARVDRQRCPPDYFNLIAESAAMPGWTKAVSTALLNIDALTSSMFAPPSSALGIFRVGGRRKSPAFTTTSSCFPGSGAPHASTGLARVGIVAVARFGYFQRQTGRSFPQSAKFASAKQARQSRPLRLRPNRARKSGLHRAG